MAPKADPKKKKEESSSEEDDESYEYETESSSSEKKPAAKKADDKKAAPAAAAADTKKDAAKPAAAAAAKKAESSSEDEESDESYEYETESESSEKKPAAGAAAAKPATAAGAVIAAKAAEDNKAGAAKADDKKKDAAAAKKGDDDDSEEYEYEYESEYESESDPKAAAGKTAAAAGAAKPAAGGSKVDDKGKAAATATTTTKATTTTTTTTTTSPAQAAAMAGGKTGAAAPVVVAGPPVGVMVPANQHTRKDVAAAMIAELVGTFILCYVIFQFRLQTETWTVQEPNGYVESHALVQAFAVGSMTAAFGYISQAQFNPAVTLTMMLLRQTRWYIGLAYIVLQFAGAIIAGVLAWGLAPPLTQFALSNPNTGSHPHLNSYGTGFAAPYACSFWGGVLVPPAENPQCWREGFGAEIVGTFIFLMIYLMCFVAGHGELAWFSVASGLAICVFAFHSTSNAFFNPARAIGGAVFTFNYVWNNFWIYIIGPLIGSIMAVLVFGLIFQTRGDKSKGANLFNHSN